MKRDIDKQIEKELSDYTEMRKGDKEMMWKEIENKIATESGRKRQRKSTRKTGIITTVASVAAIAMIAFGSQTSTGHALIDQIKTIFEPEKEIVQNIEGMEEKNTANLNEGSKSEYIIYVDEERYQFIKGEEFDKITVKEKAEGIPEVGMDIQQYENKEPESILNEIHKEWAGKGTKVTDIEQINTPIKGYSFRVVDGNEWNSEIHKFIAIDNGNEGSFVFKQYYFLEAAEGHGVRLDQMLKDFQIVTPE